MQYLRDSESRVRILATFFPAVVVTGARQTGKTTLLRQLFPNYHYVSLDLPSQAEEANRDPQSFIRKNPAPVIIDEVQYAPDLFRHLKTVIDQNRDARGQFILTGSQKFTLMKSVTDSLAGRVGLMELEGLSAGELGSSLQHYLQKHGPAKTLARGFYPQLWRELDFPSFEYYQSYIATYLERDVRQILNVTSLRDFERFMRACAIRSGQILNKSELAKDVGIHHKTANDWLSVLQASNQIFLLEPFFNSETKRIVKSPKLYFADTGLLCSLLGLREDSIEHYASLGSIWETYLYSQFRKHRTNQGLGYTTWFYRDQQGLEVDFLVESAGKLNLFEAKWSQLPDQKAIAPMNRLQEKLENISKKWFLCRTDSSFPMNDTQVVNGFCDNSWLESLQYHAS
jgi:predicted AAA+ superfamily ATPase